MYIGWPGKVHDARVFANSSIKGQNKTLFPDWTEKISGVDIPVVILGDPAYPLLRWVMKAFGNLSHQQRKFNCCVLHHNICEIHGDEFNVEWMEGVERNGFCSSTGC